MRKITLHRTLCVVVKRNLKVSDNPGRVLSECRRKFQKLQTDIQLEQEHRMANIFRIKALMNKVIGYPMKEVHKDYQELRQLMIYVKPTRYELIEIMDDVELFRDVMHDGVTVK